MLKLKIKDKVFDSSDALRHVGIIESFKGSSARVRWHRGFASWVSIDKLELAQVDGPYES